MSSLFSYQGKKVVLTGGATGVGAAAVELLSELGCTDLTVLDVKEPTGPRDALPPHRHVRSRRDRRRGGHRSRASTCCSTTPASPACTRPSW